MRDKHGPFHSVIIVAQQESRGLGAHTIEAGIIMMSCDMFVVASEMFALHDKSMCVATATFRTVQDASMA